MNTSGEPRWRRIFARRETVPPLERIREALACHHWPLEGSYVYDDTGWIEATFETMSGNFRWTIRRYTRADDDIRGELQSWAAFVETFPDNPHCQVLMNHLTGTQQVFTFEQPDGMPDQTSLALCRCLAQAAEGVYQIDGSGFFTATGESLGFCVDEE